MGVLRSEEEETSLLVCKELGCETVTRTPGVAKTITLEWKRGVSLCKPPKHVSINVEHLD